MSLADEKNRLRDVMGVIRKEISKQDRRAAQAAVGEALIDLAPRLHGRSIGAYLAMGSELDCTPALSRLAAHGFSLAMPVVTAAAQALTFRAWRPGAVLENGLHGTRHPASPAPEKRPDILLIPLMAFDRCGRRLGRGGGYYDRTLAALRGEGPLIGIGVAFARQEVDQVPVDSRDAPLDWIVTENGAIKGHSK